MGGAGSTQRVGPRGCIDCLAPHQAPEGFGKKSVCIFFFLRVFPPEAAPRYDLRCAKLRVLKGLCQDPVSHPSFNGKCEFQAPGGVEQRSLPGSHICLPAPSPPGCEQPPKKACFDQIYRPQARFLLHSAR